MNKAETTPPTLTKRRRRRASAAPGKETPKTPLLQPVDDATRALARRLVRTARYGALAVLDPATGHPLASRVALSTDVDGTPLILISSLSAHTGALAADARCSLLCGEPGRGDPLAHARITLVTKARRIDRGDEDTHARARRRYLARQPKAALYADFGDFAFWRLEVQRASLNGGFGRAFELEAGDVLSEVTSSSTPARQDAMAPQDQPAPSGRPAESGESGESAAPVVPDIALDAFATLEAEAVAHMNDDHPQTVDLYATALAGTTAGDWRLATIDPHGFELTRADEVRRLEFDHPVQEAGGLHAALIAMARRARELAARRTEPEVNGVDGKAPNDGH